MNNSKSRLFIPEDFCESSNNNVISNASNIDYSNHNLVIPNLCNFDISESNTDSTIKLPTYQARSNPRELLHKYNSSNYSLEQDFLNRRNFEPSSKSTCTDLSDINFKIYGSSCDTSINFSKSCVSCPLTVVHETSVAVSNLPLLTPDNFLLCSWQKTDSATNLQCGATYVPGGKDECSSISHPKNFTCTVDQFVLTDNSISLPICNAPQEESYIYNLPIVQNFYSNERKNIVPDNHARRKLIFENEEGNADITNEDKTYPKFQCSILLPDRESLSCNASYIENQSEFSNFHKTKIDLPPIGVFWDIENCRVPKGLSATHVVQEIRNRFFSGHKEAEFVCVCDTLKENPKVLEELNDAQVNIMHVGSIVKNAADDKLLQGMRRFADLHGTGATIILISGDSDFATELYDLRYRKRLHIILIHNAHAQDSLKLSAHETVLFSEVTQEVPVKNVKLKSVQLSRDITVWNLPQYVDTQSVRKRLQYLASNCGGRGIFVRNGTARICFQTPELAARAKKRIEGEDVYGNKVICTFAKDNQSSRFKTPGPQVCNPIPASGERDYLAETKFIPIGSKLQNEQAEMEVNVGMWNKPGGAMNGHSVYLHNTWAGQQSPNSQMMHDMGGGSYNSSPILHSSSQGSSRESSPHLSFPKCQDIHNRNSYRICSTMTSKPVQHLNEFRPVDVNRTPRISQPWPGSYSKGNWQSPGSGDLQNQSLYSLGNLSLADTSQLDDENEEPNVTLVDRSYINDLWIKSRKILWDVAKCSVSVKEFTQLYTSKFSQPPKMEILKKDLDEFIQVTGDEENGEVKLVPLQTFARDLLILLYEAGGRMLLMNFETAYLNRFGVACRPATLGFPNLVALVQSLGSMATIKGRGTKRIIVLEKDLNLELPSYCPPQPRNVIKPVKEIDTWPGNPLPVNPVPPPPNYSKANGNSAPPPTPPCDHKFYHSDVLNRHMMMGFTSPTPQPYNQPTSPVVSPPNPSELPSPGLFSHNSLKLCLDNSHDCLSVENNSQLGSPTKSGSGPKVSNKRLAAQFNGSSNN